MIREHRASALLDPKGAYGHPLRVLADRSLSVRQKRAVLKHWHTDAVRMEESEAEGFDGGEPSMLEQVTAALRDVDTAADQ